MDNPLISVIVPIYNVEAYLQRCVDSIRHQTYKNLEIVLVDDGSIDNCGRMCDEFAKEDSRIAVIHRENGGLSAARNSGLDICKGEYIGFVDADDCIHPEMYGLLVKDIQDNGSFLSFCQPNMCKNQVVKDVVLDEPTLCYGKDFIFQKCLIDNIWWSACTKLYHYSLFNDIRFPEGRTNEDYPIAIRVYDKCERIAVNYNKLYNYCLRQGSIARSEFRPHKFDQIDSAKDVMEYMQNNHQEWVEAAQKNLLASCIGLLSNLVKENNTFYAEKKKTIYKIVHENFISGIRNKYLTKGQKMLLIASYIHPTLFDFIYKTIKL